MKRKYIAPKVKKYQSISELPEHVRKELEGKHFVILRPDRTYVLVSDSFAEMLGYEPQDLMGRRLDDLTPEGVMNIELPFRALLELGEMDGLWLLKHRDGSKVLVRYHAQRSDSILYADVEPLTLAA